MKLNREDRRLAERKGYTKCEHCGSFIISKADTFEIPETKFSGCYDCGVKESISIINSTNKKIALLQVKDKVKILHLINDISEAFNLFEIIFHAWLFKKTLKTLNNLFEINK